MRVGFTAAEDRGFKKGTSASDRRVPMVAPDQTVDIDLSLEGFAEGYAAVTAANAATSGRRRPTAPRR